jgi:molybdopterin synthase catalytic subunit
MHSKMVTRAMKEIIDGEGGDEDVLIPAAMLHDIGWLNVPEKYQFAKTDEDKKTAERLHLEKAPKLIKEILGELDYNSKLIEKIIRVVINHKSKKPNGDREIECIVDADNLSDTYQESFYSDVISYNSTPLKTLNFRSKNKFFTKTAEGIFKMHLEARQKEIESGKAKELLKKAEI